MNELCHLENMFTMKQKSKKKTQHYELISLNHDDQETQPQKRQRTANAAENRGRAQTAPMENPMRGFFGAHWFGDISNEGIIYSGDIPECGNTV